MLFPANKGPDLNDAGKMHGVKRADGATSDDANSLHIRAALHPFLYLDQFIRLIDFLRHNRAVQGICVVEGIAYDNSAGKESVLQRGGERMNGRGTAFSHSLCATVTVRRRRLDMSVFHGGHVHGSHWRAEDERGGAQMANRGAHPRFPEWGTDAG